MMTSSNGNIFRVTGHLCGEFPGPRWIPRTKASDAELWCFLCQHDDVIKWKHFPRNWPFVRGIHRSPVNSPHKSLWRGALMFSLICTKLNGFVNTREAGELRRHLAHYDVNVMRIEIPEDSSVILKRLWKWLQSPMYGSKLSILLRIHYRLRRNRNWYFFKSYHTVCYIFPRALDFTEAPMNNSIFCLFGV